jgi:hypothetical protein
VRYVLPLFFPLVETFLIANQTGMPIAARRQALYNASFFHYSALAMLLWAGAFL